MAVSYVRVYTCIMNFNSCGNFSYLTLRYQCSYHNDQACMSVRLLDQLVFKVQSVRRSLSPSTYMSLCSGLRMSVHLYVTVQWFEDVCPLICHCAVV